MPFYTKFCKIKISAEIAEIFTFKLVKLFNLRCLTNSITEIVKLSSSNLTKANYLNLSNVWRMKWECLFNTTAVSNTSYSKCFGDATVVLSNNSAFENLDSFSCALFDKVVCLPPI